VTEDLLRAWLPNQRWFAGKGRDFAIVAVEPLDWLTDPAGERPRVRIELAGVRYPDGAYETYQLPLEYRDEPADHLGHACLGETDLDGGHVWVYDALHDKAVTGLWLAGIAADRRLSQLSFHREPAAPPFPVDEPSLVSGAEQSNTSLVFGNSVILKVFRKATPGLNPDVELHDALARVGSTNVATLLGWLDGTWTDPRTGERTGGTLAMAQEFLRSATGAWEIALTSVRDLLAEADLHADEVGGDFAAESYRLGQTVAEVHADLARTLPTALLGPAELSTLTEGMQQRLGEAAAAVPQLAPYADRLSKVYDDLAARDEPVRVQRVHGDLHLGQVMRVPGGWKIIDFEGEPARPLEERRAPAPPAKDVAGMLRSYDYAARHLLKDRRPDAQLEYRADEWAERNRGAFCDGYGAASGRDPRQDQALLRAFEVDKAVYEVMYESRNRPSWLSVPMSAVRRLAG
jgi:maltokinase